ncbi:cytoplasmic RNA-binding protein [Tulasnella sp. UAMH 9824]|nr:cytoplasmic RNA-binding protein [Tulasnella sp. UAMH 9824]
MSDPKTDIEDLDAEIQGMRARVAELEEEADKKAEAAAMQALLNGEAETPFTAKEVAKAENGASDTAADGTAEVEVEEEDAAAVDGRSVYVGNVDYGATPEELQQHFLSCGSINRITIVCDKFTGNPKGYAYVEFSDPASLQSVLIYPDSTKEDGEGAEAVIEVATEAGRHNITRILDHEDVVVAVVEASKSCT